MVADVGILSYVADTVPFVRIYQAVHAFEDVSRVVLRAEQYLPYRDRFAAAVILLAWANVGASLGLPADPRDWPVNVAGRVVAAVTGTPAAGRARLAVLAPHILAACAASLHRTARLHDRGCVCAPDQPCPGRRDRILADSLHELAVAGPDRWELPSAIGLGVFDAELRDLMHAEA